MSKLSKGSEVGDYVILKRQATGSYATVFKAEHKPTHLLVALKAIPKANIKTDQDIKCLQQEIAFMKSMDHPFIAEFYELIENYDYIFLVMEWVENGSLLNLVNNHQGLEETVVRRLFIELVIALGYLHKDKCIVHRDLKAENIMIDRNYHIKIIDFGLSHDFSPELPFMNTSCGSPAYASPEIILKRAYTHQTDMWSLGVILYAMTFGSLPFYDENMHKMFKLIIYSVAKIPEGTNADLSELIFGLLAKIPENRYSIDEVANHAWIKNSAEFNIFSRVQIALENLSMTPFKECDQDTCHEMHKIGLEFNLSSLYNDLQSNVQNKCTVAYKIIKREYNHKLITNKFLNFKEDATNLFVKVSRSTPQCTGLYLCRRNNKTHRDTVPRSAKPPENNDSKLPTYLPKAKKPINVPVRVRNYSALVTPKHHNTRY